MNPMYYILFSSPDLLTISYAARYHRPNTTTPFNLFYTESIHSWGTTPEQEYTSNVSTVESGHKMDGIKDVPIFLFGMKR